MIMEAKRPWLAAIDSAAGRSPTDGELASLGSATEWLNSEPLTAVGLRGKVVQGYAFTFG